MLGNSLAKSLVGALHFDWQEGATGCRTELATFGARRIVKNMLVRFAASGCLILFFQLSSHLAVLAISSEMTGVFTTYGTVSGYDCGCCGLLQVGLRLLQC